MNKLCSIMLVFVWFYEFEFLLLKLAVNFKILKFKNIFDIEIIKAKKYSGYILNKLNNWI